MSRHPCCVSQASCRAQGREGGRGVEEAGGPRPEGGRELPLLWMTRRIEDTSDRACPDEEVWEREEAGREREGAGEPKDGRVDVSEMTDAIPAPTSFKRSLFFFSSSDGYAARDCSAEGEHLLKECLDLGGGSKHAAGQCSPFITLLRMFWHGSILVHSG